MAKLREDHKHAIGPNDVWAMDFVHDQLATGRMTRVLTVVDTFSRYVPVLDGNSATGAPLRSVLRLRWITARQCRQSWIVRGGR